MGLNRWQGKSLKLYSKLLTSSQCLLRLRRDARGNLLRLVIEFHGELSNLPAKSNDHRSTSSGKVVHSEKLKVQLSALTELYHYERLRRGLGHISFGNTPIHCQAFLGPKMHKQDSHNAPKLIGDWLESIGVVNNDRHAQIWPAFWSDYPPYREDSGTVLVIEPLMERKMMLRQFMKRFLDEE